MHLNCNIISNVDTVCVSREEAIGAKRKRRSSGGRLGGRGGGE